MVSRTSLLLLLHPSVSPDAISKLAHSHYSKLLTGTGRIMRTVGRNIRRVRVANILENKELSGEVPLRKSGRRYALALSPFRVFLGELREVEVSGLARQCGSGREELSLLSCQGAARPHHNPMRRDLAVEISPPRKNTCMPQAVSQSSRGESSVPASPTISHHWSEQSNLAFPSSDLLTDSPRQSITGQTFEQPAAPPLSSRPRRLS